MKLLIQQMGDSVMVCLPDVLLAQLGAEVGSTLDVTATKGGVLFTPERRSSYAQAYLLAQCDARQPMPEDLVAWDSCKPVDMHLGPECDMSRDDSLAAQTESRLKALDELVAQAQELNMGY